MNVNVNARVGADKSVTCDIDVGGLRVAVVFDGGQVLFTAPTTTGDYISFAVPESIVARGHHG